MITPDRAFWRAIVFTIVCHPYAWAPRTHKGRGRTDLALEWGEWAMHVAHSGQDNAPGVPFSPGGGPAGTHSRGGSARARAIRRDRIMRQAMRAAIIRIRRRKRRFPWRAARRGTFGQVASVGI